MPGHGAFINDFPAQSLAILHLQESDIERLGIPRGAGCDCVLGPGTVLVRLSHPNRAGWHVVAGEGSSGCPTVRACRAGGI